MPSKAINLLVEVIGAILLATIVIGLIMFANNAINKPKSQLTKMVNNASDYVYDNYDGQTVSGTEVETIIKQYATEEIAIKVVTKSGTTTSYGENPTIVKDKTLDSYINPSGNFKGSVQRNSNNVITSVTFAQS